MKGYVSKYLSEKSYGFIRGEDGRDYFFLKHKEDGTPNCYANVKAGNIVDFLPRKSPNPEKPLQWAMDIRKLATGRHHCFAHDMERVKEVVETFMPECEEKRYRIRDIDRMIRWVQHLPIICEHCGEKIEPILFKWEDENDEG